MSQSKIKLNATEEVQEFVNAASRCDFDIDVYYNRFLIETTNGQILKNVPKTVFCVWVIKTNLKYIDISGGSWYDKNRNKSAISRKGDGYGIGTGNKIP